MFYRDLMQKYRPVYSPDEPAAPAAPAGGEAAPAAAAPAEVVAAPAAEAAPAAPAAPAEASLAAEAPAADKPAPSLLEAATSKKPEPAKESAPAEAAPDAAPKDPAKDEPAPSADAKKPDAADAKAPDAKAEGAADDPAKKDATAEAPPPAPIKYEAFKTPDGIKLDDARIGKFAEIAGPAQIPQDIAQQLVDLYVEDVQQMQRDVVKAAQDEQKKAWNTYVDTITRELRNDPELGGNRLETSLSMAKATIEEFLPANEAAEYLALLTHNGMGNHRLQVKMLHEIGRRLNIFEDGLMPANPRSPKPQKGPGNRGWYDKSLNNGGAAAT